MSKDLNQCNFIGRLGKDVDVKYAPSGNAIANFSIACGDDYKSKDGQKVEQTNWINIVAFGGLAEICGEYLRKGSQVYISGKQVTRKWKDKEGQDRYTTEIVTNDMQMIGSREDAQTSSQGNSATASSDVYNSTTASVQPSSIDEWDDELPF